MKTFFGFGRAKALAALLCGVLVAGYAGASARKAPENPGMFTLTGIPAEYDGKRVNIDLSSVPHRLVINSTGSRRLQGNVNVAVTNGELNLPVYKQEYFSTTGYTGTETLDVNCIIIDEEDLARKRFNMATKISFNSVRFENGVAKVNWNDGAADWLLGAAPPTGVSAIPVQATQPAPAAPLVQLPLEKIFVGGTPPQGTRDDYAAVLPSLNDALDWLDIYTRDGGNYAIVLGSDQEASEVVLGYGDKRVTITFAVSGGGRTVNRQGGIGTGTLFYVEKGVTLMLEEGVTLSSTSVTIVISVSGGTFIMNGGMLRGVDYAAAVEITSGSFTVNGGSISGYSGNRGAGIRVFDGTFTTNGGTISGGVDVNKGGVFTMESGTISGYVNVNSSGTFTMNGGTISGNKGRGVYINVGTFTMNGGTISENEDRGVYVVAGTFTMNGGTISGNNNSGVEVDGILSSFTMNGGTISGNTANYGGGVSVVSGGTFTKSGTGGIIYGSNAPAGQANKAKSEAGGHAVHVGFGRPQKRTTTADETTALDSTKNLVQGGGWE